MHHVVTTKIGTRSQGLTRQNKKERGRSNPADWCWSRGAVDRQFRFLRVNQVIGSWCGFGPVTHPESPDSPDSPERSKSPVHFFFPPSLFGCELPPCLGSQLGSPDLGGVYSVHRTEMISK